MTAPRSDGDGRVIVIGPLAFRATRDTVASQRTVTVFTVSENGERKITDELRGEYATSNYISAFLKHDKLPEAEKTEGMRLWGPHVVSASDWPALSSWLQAMAHG